MLIGLLMVGAGTATPTVAATTVAAPYHGLTYPSNSLSEYGCNSHAALLKHWHFNMSMGMGIGEESGKAAACGLNQPPGTTIYSDAYTDGGFTVYAKLPKISASATTVSVNVRGTMAMSLLAKSGSTSGLCNNGVSSYYHNDTTWEWGWTGTYFGSYAYNDASESNGIWYNYSYNVASIPSPFNLNNTTYYYHSEGFSQYGSCYASAYSYMSPYAELYNAHTHSYSYYSSTTGQGFRDQSISVSNTTDWYWQNYTDWDGPYSINTTSPTTFYTYNSSLATDNCLDQEVNGSYSYSCTTGTGSSISNSTVLSFTSSWNFTGPFSTTNLYYAELTFYADAGASNDWKHGSASFLMNAGTGAYGIKLSSITIS